MKIVTQVSKHISHFDWLSVLTRYFSGVFVYNLWFSLIVRVNVVSCRVTLYPVERFFLSKNTL